MNSKNVTTNIKLSYPEFFKDYDIKNINQINFIKDNICYPIQFIETELINFISIPMDNVTNVKNIECILENLLSNEKYKKYFSNGINHFSIKLSDDAGLTFFKLLKKYNFRFDYPLKNYGYIVFNKSIYTGICTDS